MDSASGLVSATHSRIETLELESWHVYFGGSTEPDDPEQTSDPSSTLSYAGASHARYSETTTRSGEDVSTINGGVVTQSPRVETDATAWLSGASQQRVDYFYPYASGREDSGQDTLAEQYLYEATLHVETDNPGATNEKSKFSLSESLTTAFQQHGSGSSVVGVVDDPAGDWSRTQFSYHANGEQGDRVSLVGTAASEEVGGAVVESLHAVIVASSYVNLSGGGETSGSDYRVRLEATEVAYENTTETTSGYSFTASAASKLNATIDEVGERSVVQGTAESSNDYQGTQTGSVDGDETRTDDGVATDTTFGLRTAGESASGGSVSARFYRDNDTSRSSGDFRSYASASATTATQAYGTTSEPIEGETEPLVTPFRSNEVLAATLSASTEGVFELDDRVTTANPNGISRSEGHAKRLETTDVKSTDWQGLSGDVEVAALLGEGYVALAILPQASYALSKRTSSSRDEEDYEFLDEGEGATRQGTFESSRRGSVETESFVHAMGAGQAGDGYEQKDRASSGGRYSATTAGAFVSTDAGRSADAAVEELSETWSKTKYELGANGTEDGTTTYLQTGLETGAYASESSRGLVTLEDDAVTTAAMDVVFESMSQAVDVLDVDSFTKTRVVDGGKTNDTVAISDYRSQTTVGASSTGEGTSTQSGGQTTSKLEVGSVQTADTHERSRGTTNIETTVEESGAVTFTRTEQYQSDSTTRAGSRTTAAGPVTSGPTGTSSDMTVTTTATGEVKDTLTWSDTRVDVDQDGNESVAETGTRTDKAGSRREATLDVTSTTDSRSRSDGEFNVTSKADLYLDTRTDYTYPTSGGRTKTRTSTGHVDQSETVSASGNVRDDHGQTTVELNGDPKRTQSGDYDFGDESTSSKAVQGAGEGEGSFEKQKTTEKLTGGFGKPEKAEILDESLLRELDGPARTYVDDQGRTVTLTSTDEGEGRVTQSVLREWDRRNETSWSTIAPYVNDDAEPGWETHETYSRDTDTGRESATTKIKGDLRTLDLESTSRFEHADGRIDRFETYQAATQDKAQRYELIEDSTENYLIRGFVSTYDAEHTETNGLATLGRFEAQSLRSTSDGTKQRDLWNEITPEGGESYIWEETRRDSGTTKTVFIDEPGTYFDFVDQDGATQRSQKGKYTTVETTTTYGSTDVDVPDYSLDIQVAHHPYLVNGVSSGIGHGTDTREVRRTIEHVDETTTTVRYSPEETRTLSKEVRGWDHRRVAIDHTFESDSELGEVVGSGQRMVREYRLDKSDPDASYDILDIHVSINVREGVTPFQVTLLHGDGGEFEGEWIESNWDFDPSLPTNLVLGPGVTQYGSTGERDPSATFAPPPPPTPIGAGVTNPGILEAFVGGLAFGAVELANAAPLIDLDETANRLADRAGVPESTRTQTRIAANVGVGAGLTVFGGGANWLARGVALADRAEELGDRVELAGDIVQNGFTTQNTVSLMLEAAGVGPSVARRATDAVQDAGAKTRRQLNAAQAEVDAPRNKQPEVNSPCGAGGALGHLHVAAATGGGDCNVPPRPNAPSGAGAPQAAEVVAPKKVTVKRSQHPESAQHIEDAQRAGHPKELTLDRANADANRAESLRGIDKVKGKQLDEYPPAFTKEGGKGASVRPVDPSDNMGAGARIGNLSRGVPDGARIIIEVVD
ncbi:Sporulation-specific extracellular nuclease precursor [Pirellulimonas nuda]|uniref:Sporulation-specific extracellular nuclease n=1 Tax=Pirellulimonas nuda TaxID=2528009 RepID=A0A518DG72_9BACT|nr:NucA/NucB deoxyribonuclease domain-containing protein [Pirellulimonas nuda]QDU90474.1 Sporulation-specific extracellular nuclease precursor [Pirellulimonas nuda]